jgi:hypothetical protein
MITRNLKKISYVFDSSFQKVYIERDVDCYADFLDEVPSASHIKKDARALYGVVITACQSGVGRRILMLNINWHKYHLRSG